MKRLLLLALSATIAALAAGPALAAPPSWTRPVEPFRIAGNIHYVGTEELGAYLLIGDEGAILLDAPMEENAEHILASIRKLGVDPKKVRILLSSHAHFDHGGGFAKIKAATGGKLYLSKADAELFARGGRNDFAFGDRFLFAPVTADELLRDKQTVRLGDISMTAMITPGHTKGCTTWRTTVVEKGKPLDVVFLCSVTAPGYQLARNDQYPEIVRDYRRTFATLRRLDPDIFLANHASFFNLAGKMERLKEGRGNPFIARGQLARHVEQMSKAFEAELEKQRKEQRTKR